MAHDLSRELHLRGEEDRLRAVARQLVLAAGFEEFAEIEEVGFDQLLIHHLRCSAGHNDIVQEWICTVQSSERILRHALQLAVAVLHPHWHHFLAHEPKGGRHGGGVLRALCKGHLLIPMLLVEDAEDQLALLFLQQVDDEGQGVGVVFGL